MLTARVILLGLDLGSGPGSGYARAAMTFRGDRWSSFGWARTCTCTRTRIHAARRRCGCIRQHSLCIPKSRRGYARAGGFWHIFEGAVLFRHLFMQCSFLDGFGVAGLGCRRKSPYSCLRACCCIYIFSLSLSVLYVILSSDRGAPTLDLNSQGSTNSLKNLVGELELPSTAVPDVRLLAFKVRSISTIRNRCYRCKVRRQLGQTRLAITRLDLSADL